MIRRNCSNSALDTLVDMQPWANSPVRLSVVRYPRCSETCWSLDSVAHCLIVVPPFENWLWAVALSLSHVFIIVLFSTAHKNKCRNTSSWSCLPVVSKTSPRQKAPPGEGRFSKICGEQIFGRRCIKEERAISSFIRSGRLAD